MWIWCIWWCDRAMFWSDCWWYSVIISIFIFPQSLNIQHRISKMTVHCKKQNKTKNQKTPQIRTQSRKIPEILKKKFHLKKKPISSLIFVYLLHVRARRWSRRRSVGSSGHLSRYASRPGSCRWSALEGNTTPSQNASPSE